jgi:hypothetical protein
MRLLSSCVDTQSMHKLLRLPLKENFQVFVDDTTIKRAKPGIDELTFEVLFNSAQRVTGFGVGC